MSLVQAHPDVAVADDGGGRVVVVRCDVRDARPVVLEGSAALVWRVVAGRAPLAPSDVVEAVVAATGAPRAVVADDVVRFLVDLESAGLVEPLP